MQFISDNRLPSSTLSASPSGNSILGGDRLVFVDENLQSYRQLAVSSHAEVVVLDADRDGLSQITAVLAGRSNLQSVQILSHGAAGQLQLGNINLNTDNLGIYAAQVSRWGNALSPTGDLLLYGCNLTSDATGIDFVNQLAQLTGADVGASQDLTGSVQRGGNWILETQIGTIESNLALSQAIQTSYDGVFANFNYNNFATTDGLQLNGTATQSGTSLQLTPASLFQAGSAFYATPFLIDGNTSFNTRFQFQLSGGDGEGGADGFTFAIQNSTTGASALGADGGGVGYTGIGRSLAIEFDTSPNEGDPDGNHISLLRDGATTAVRDGLTGITLNSGATLTAWIDYNGATNRLDVYVSTGTAKPATAVLSEVIDLAAVVGDRAYFGFTGGTGGLSNIQAVQNWQFDTTANPVGTGAGGTGNGLKGEYFDNRDFTGKAFERTDATVNFNWGSGSPDSRIAADTFSVRWSGQVEAKFNEVYTFYTTTDDGVRLRVNGQTVVDRLVDQASTTASGTIRLEAGKKYDIQMDYYENGGLADAKLEWSSASQTRQIIPKAQLYSGGVVNPPTGGGLLGSYYRGRNFDEKVFERTDTTVDFDWGGGGPDARLPVDNFSVSWTGKVKPLYTEDYTFFTTTDDGVRLFVNDQEIISAFAPQASTRINSRAIRLTAGQEATIRMEYFEASGQAEARLGWQSARQTAQIIPQSQLTPSSLPPSGVIAIDTTDVSVRESDGTATVVVRRTGDLAAPASFNYTLNEDTAKAGTDFTGSRGTVQFATNSATASFAIPILNDNVAEPTERLSFALTTVNGAALGQPRTAIVTIVDDDATGSSFAFSKVSYDAKEDAGQATITVQRSGDISRAASVNYATSNGTAIAGQDYTAVANTLQFAANQGTATFNVAVTNDTIGERNEALNLTLSSPTGGTLGSQRTATLNILDNDPGSFAKEDVVTNLTNPTAIDWSPDGRYMFIAQQNGEVKVQDTTNPGQAPRTFIDIRDQVNGIRDRGLLGMTLDPQFASGRPYVYLLFTYDPPEAGQTTRPGYSPFGAKDGKGNRPGRLIRVDAEFVGGQWRAKAGTERILLGKNSNFANTRGFDQNSTEDFTIPASGFIRNGQGANTAESVQDYISGDSESHSVGYVQFGKDGKLYVSIGDGTSYNDPDPRTVRVQDIDNLSGKILRIDPDTGAGLADNPFYNVNTGSPFDAKYNSNVNSNRSRVYNLGLRNPFRFTFNPQGNLPVIGDVGWNSWEEINTGRGKNFGWPAYEGGLNASGTPTNLRTPGYQNDPNVQVYYPGGSRAINAEAPAFGFRHQGGGDAIIMGEFYTGNTFPVFYENALFFSNANRGTVSTAFFDGAGRITGTQLFAENSFGIAQLTVGPDGSLYAVNLGVPIDTGVQGQGSITRWRPTNAARVTNAPANAPEVINAPNLKIAPAEKGLFNRS